MSPPAWERVWICPDPVGHIQATGFDAAVRKQYLYHPRWRTPRDQRKFDDIVDFAEVGAFLDTPVKRYSSGMFVRLAFAVASHMEPEILLVDEVLAVGDVAFQKKCLGKMG